MIKCDSSMKSRDKINKNEVVHIVGSGYVGLVTGACLAHLGFQVTCIDVVRDKIEDLSQGKCPIFEAGLRELLVEGLENGRLQFSLFDDADFTGATVVFLCLQTPSSEDGSTDFSYVKTAVTDLSSRLAPKTIVVNKSTMPIGSFDLVSSLLGRDDLAVVSNPEFLREGSAVIDFLKPDRIVLGSNNTQAIRRVSYLYETLNAPVFETDPHSAELIKYASNFYLAMRVSYANSIATLCEAIGGDVLKVLDAVGADHRIGAHALIPGPGWGGSCLGKDLRALCQTATESGYDFDLARVVAEINKEQIRRTARKVIDALGGSVRDRDVAVWGLTFKAGTDDLRESPAFGVIDHLLEGGASITAYDPMVRGSLIQRPHMRIASDMYEAVKDAAVLVVLTEWQEFADADLTRVAQMMSEPNVVDARFILDRNALSLAGFRWIGIGNS